MNIFAAYIVQVFLFVLMQFNSKSHKNTDFRRTGARTKFDVHV